MSYALGGLAPAYACGYRTGQTDCGRTSVAGQSYKKPALPGLFSDKYGMTF